MNERVRNAASAFEERLRLAHTEIRCVVDDWLASHCASMAQSRVIPLEAPGGPGVEVIPKNALAATVFLRLETPGEMVLHLGRESWWDGLPPDPKLIRMILDAVSQGKFSETVRLCCGRVMTSHGELRLPEETWNDRKVGLPIGRRVVEAYKPFGNSSTDT